MLRERESERERDGDTQRGVCVEDIPVTFKNLSRRYFYFLFRYQLTASNVDSVGEHTSTTDRKVFRITRHHHHHHHSRCPPATCLN